MDLARALVVNVGLIPRFVRVDATDTHTESHGQVSSSKPLMYLPMLC